MTSKKGCFFKLLTSFLVLLIVLIVLLVVLFLLATGAPTSYPAPKLDGSDTGVIANVITRLARSLVDKEGRVVDTAVLRLTQNEVQTLLNTAIARSNDRGYETLPYAVAWNEGNLHVHFSLPMSTGRAANISMEVSPYVDLGELTLVPGGGSVGAVPLPGPAMDSAAKHLEQMAMKDDNIRTALSAFTRIEPGDDGTLVLMFDPRDVNTVIRVLRSAGAPPEEDRHAGNDADEDADEDSDGIDGENEERMEKNGE